MPDRAERGRECRSTKCLDYVHGYSAGFAAGAKHGRLLGAAEGPAHPAIAESVRRMLGDWDGEALAHARSVDTFRNEYLPHDAHTSQCHCGDWARGYAYRDTMSTAAADTPVTSLQQQKEALPHGLAA